MILDSPYFEIAVVTKTTIGVVVVDPDGNEEMLSWESSWHLYD